MKQFFKVGINVLKEMWRDRPFYGMRIQSTTVYHFDRETGLTTTKETTEAKQPEALWLIIWSVLVAIIIVSIITGLILAVKEVL